MKKLSLFLLILISITFCYAKTAEVFFTKDISANGVLKVYEKIKSKVSGNVAVKVHFGEEKSDTYLKPYLMKKLVEKVNGTFIETNVLYLGKRRYTESHIQLAKDHGFTYAPINIIDDKGDKNIKVNMKHYKEIRTGKDIDKYDSIIIFSHFKGHGSAGFGGAIKNVSMGLASVSGKMHMHASQIPNFDPESCVSCGQCVLECPADAITLNPLKIDKDKCIGCGKCIGVCPTKAFSIPWGSTDKNVFQERLVEYAKGISDYKNMVYINVIANVTPYCDCMRRKQTPFVADIGIVASTDMLAVDKASLDLVNKKHNCKDAFKKETGRSGQKQIDYAKEIGLGSLNYNLVDLDK